ncbi:MAG TPA: isoprenylcysteine carboxylmethyltransferase family protein [Ardenticatenaceae bacterium]|jgi:protein-S-isoprenylcysteine O-methyltransferase Ste14
MGKRGEGWVVLQFLLIAAIVLVPRRSPEAVPNWIRYLGLPLMAAGAALGGAATLNLGSNLTPLPKPVENGQLVRSGAYSVVRHPIYLAVVLGMVGFSLLRASVGGLALTGLLFAFFDRKARREEAWLREQYGDYAEYQQQVRRLLPWLY